MHVYFDHADATDDPGLPGRAIVVPLPGYGPWLRDWEIAAAVAQRVTADPKFAASVAAPESTLVTITDAAPGLRSAITAGTSGFPVAVTGAGSTGAEVSSLTFTGLDGIDLAGVHLEISGAAGRYYIWWEVEGNSPDPAPGGFLAGIKVPSILADMTAPELAYATGILLNAHAAFLASFTGDTVTVTDAAVGVRAAASAGTSDVAVARVSAGNTSSVVQVTLVTILADPAAMLGQYFSLEDAAGPVYIWWNRAGAYSDPAPGGYTRGLEVDIGAVDPDVVANYVNALQSVVHADAAWGANHFAANVRIIDAAPGARAATLGNISSANLTFSVQTQGGSGTVQTSTVQLAGATMGSLRGKYFSLADADGPVHVYFAYGDPGAADLSRGIGCISSTGTETGAALAETLKAAVHADAGLAAIRLGTTVTITDRASGPRTDITRGSTALSVGVVQSGQGKPTLRLHMNQQVDARLALCPPTVPNSHELFTTLTATTMIRNPANWATGLRGISSVACAMRYSNGTFREEFVGYTLISPDIVIRAAHAYEPVVGDTLYFVTEDGQNTIHAAVIAADPYIGPPNVGINDSVDIAVLKLTAPLPPSIRPMRIFSAGTDDWFSDYFATADELRVSPQSSVLNRFGPANKTPLFAVNRAMQTSIRMFPASLSATGNMTWTVPEAPSPYAPAGWFDYVGGDSGHCLAGVVGGELALAALFTGGPVGPLVPSWQTDLLAAVESLGGQPPEFYDVSPMFRKLT